MPSNDLPVVMALPPDPPSELPRRRVASRWCTFLLLGLVCFTTSLPLVAAEGKFQAGSDGLSDPTSILEQDSVAGQLTSKPFKNSKSFTMTTVQRRVQKSTKKDDAANDDIAFDGTPRPSRTPPSPTRPTPRPSRAPEPAPTRPTPRPSRAPVPGPSSHPTRAPHPAPVPRPTPHPTRAPHPAPVPQPIPHPTGAPHPAPVPHPVPVPHPAPIYPRPSPPIPDPRPSPIHYHQGERSSFSGPIHYHTVSRVGESGFRSEGTSRSKSGTGSEGFGSKGSRSKSGSGSEGSPSESGFFSGNRMPSGSRSEGFPVSSPSSRGSRSERGEGFGLHTHYVPGRFIEHEHNRNGGPPSSVPPPSFPGPAPTPAVVPTGGLVGYSIAQTNLGPGILGALLRTMSTSEIGPSVTLSGFPTGTVLSYADQFGNNVQVVTGANGLLLSAPNLGALFSILESIMVVSSPATMDYTLGIEVVSATNPGAMQTISVPVTVTPTATAPVIVAPGALSVDGTGQVGVPVQVLAAGAVNSEVLSVRFEVDRDSNGLVLGTLGLAPGVSVPGVSFTSLGNGVYTLTSSLGTAGLREAALNMFLLNGLVFRANGQSQGDFPHGISVTATLTETSGGTDVQTSTQDFISLHLGPAIGPTVPAPPSPVTAPAPSPVSAPVPTPSNSNVVACYNAGGTDFTDSAGQVWSSDSSIVVNNMGIVFSDTSVDIAGTVDDFLYQTQRFGVFAYEIPIPNGMYQVVLHFSEIFFGVAQNGHREFDVSIEGNLRYNNINIAALGGNMPLEVVTLASMETVTDGSLSISFGLGGADQPFISGIKVFKSNMAPVSAPVSAPVPTPIGPTPTQPVTAPVPAPTPTGPTPTPPVTAPVTAPVPAPTPTGPTPPVTAPVPAPTPPPVCGTIFVTNNAPPLGTCQTPVWVGIHDGSFDLYDQGTQITNSLESLAEDGNNDPLIAAFSNAPGGVFDGVVGATTICPGQTAELPFDFELVPGVVHYLSYASMVLPSNDAFVANGNPMEHPIFNANGVFQNVNFCVAGSEVLDAGSEVNDEIPVNTAFFGQSTPDTGVDQGGVIQLHPGFLPVGSGGILDSTMFRGGDFTSNGYKIMTVCVALKGDEANCMVTPEPTPQPVASPTPPGPTPTPTASPVAAPVPAPTSSPVAAPVPAPTSSPVAAPVPAPTSSPVAAPVPAPTSSPVSAVVPVCGTVYVTNNAPMQGTCQTPVWVGIHDGTFDLYDSGTAISSFLESLAEDGNNDPLIAHFGSAPGGVFDGVTGVSPICPGETAELSFDFDLQTGVTHYLSYASMVLPSNDAFVANGNPMQHPIFNTNGVFQDVNFCVEGSEVLDAGSEVNDEIPMNTAFFGQSTPDTGVDQGGVIQLHPGFLAAGSGGILDSGMFSGADFTAAGYKILTICVALKGDEDRCVVTPLPTSPPNPTDSPQSSPTDSPVTAPTDSPTKSPTASPTDRPTRSPTRPPRIPTDHPTKSPTIAPTRAKGNTSRPTSSPTGAKGNTPHPTRSP